ncbi:molecular chaperone DnaK (HSP70) [Ureibacillus xyleni]|uniref:Chaperone protein DnaK n=1 Tax=Ureibacillus xyleni TaxID=614648 RepID=A0A285SM36_9BACL|nr:Hsp70 family protein [Ureibacillus xyleni]SOC09074.1 molecular chaperone DnaK (HSP70) [Ureibacillus xyleni]
MTQTKVEEVNFQQLATDYIFEKKTIIECFSLWCHLLQDVANAKKQLKAINQFKLNKKQKWVQSGEEELAVYMSPERIENGRIVNQNKENVYFMGCILFETLFSRTFWREKRIKDEEQFLNYCNTHDLFTVNDQLVENYASKLKGVTKNEVQFIFQLLASMLRIDPNERPQSLKQIAGWIAEDKYFKSNTTFYYAEKEDAQVDQTAYLGIDFGTTNTVVVLAKEGRISEVRIEDSLTIPSAVFFKNPNTLYFGKQALTRGTNYSNSLARSFKSYMQGADGRFPNLCYQDSGEEIRITGMEIAQAFLTWVREQAIKSLQEPLNHVVVTVPAEFDNRQIETIKRATLGAGFTYVAVEREPNAAGYAYLHSTREQFTNHTNILVYDFGGGTFDVSILQRTGEKSFEIIGRDGDRNLGGDLFTNAIIDWLKEKIQEQYFEFTLDDSFNYSTDESKFYSAKSKLFEAAEEAKHALTTKNETTIILRQFPVTETDIVQFMFELTREQYEDRIMEYVERAEKAVKRALEQAEGEKGNIEIHEVVLAGGTSLTPLIQNSVEQFFGKLSNKSQNMSTMIARGASLFAMLEWTSDKEQSLLKQVVTNKVTHDFGVGVKMPNSHHLAFKELVRAGTELPCTVTESFTTETENQETLHVIIGRRSIHEREQATLFSHDAVERIDRIEIHNLTKARANELDIKVTFQFDGIGDLAVSVRILDRKGQVVQQQDLVKHADTL